MYYSFNMCKLSNALIFNTIARGNQDRFSEYMGKELPQVNSYNRTIFIFPNIRQKHFTTDSKVTVEQYPHGFDNAM